MSAIEADRMWTTGRRREWQVIACRRPLLAATGVAYLDQIAVSLRPRSVQAADNALRVFVAFLDDEHPDVAGFDHGTGRLITKDARSLNRYQVTRVLNRVARQAGVGHVHPHQLRHTLATQAINRGMRLEAVATLLGHRSMRMTMTYARIANKTVSDEYHAATAKVEALYHEQPEETPAMRHLANEHRRMLANGWCTRPRDIDCAFESICEGCGFFVTTIEFKPTLERQRDHAASHGQAVREHRYAKLVDDLEGAAG